MVNNKKVTLNWSDKPSASSIAQYRWFKHSDLSSGGSDHHCFVSTNKIIYSENLIALKLLQQHYKNRIRCIYIDPPYNTGEKFSYYHDEQAHGIWLSFMKERLILLWSLLDSEVGSLWVSIDDREMPYLRVLMDELFGRSCFMATIVWQKRYSRENRQAIGDAHEYILVYAKNKPGFTQYRNKIPVGAKQLKLYKNPNNDPKGPWRPVPMTAQAGHASKDQFYPIVTPSGRIFTPPQGRCWAMSQSRFLSLHRQGLIWFGKNGNTMPNTIRYLSDVDGLTPWSWWPHDEVGHTEQAKKEQFKLHNKRIAFDTPKPEQLLARIIHIATQPNDWVLDAFAGSGTTGAVAQKMQRRWMMIESSDTCYQLMAPRMNKVIKGCDQGGVSQACQWQGGGHFDFYQTVESGYDVVKAITPRLKIKSKNDQAL